MVVDSDYENRVRGVYSPQNGAGRDGMSEPGVAKRAAADASARTGNASQYDRDPDLYNLNDKSHGTLKLHEERLIADKLRQKKGEVSVGKHVETQQANVSVPVSEERVVIERNTPSNAGQAVTPGKDAFREGEVARVEVYEETADIHKDTVVTEEVDVRKVVDRDTVDAQKTLRKERLDVDRKATSEDQATDRDATDPHNSRDSRVQRTTR
ncbi:MAG TPA: YsnF/AvaK domain-containing protein, partial [Candidatus Obscuribacterales bacterium]